MIGEQLTFDGKPEWWRDRFTWSWERGPRTSKPVTCEPCKNGGGPADCVRPCITYSGSRAERLFG